jgi:hypothetical protein
MKKLLLVITFAMSLSSIAAVNCPLKDTYWNVNEKRELCNTCFNGLSSFATSIHDGLVSIQQQFRPFGATLSDNMNNGFVSYQTSEANTQSFTYAQQFLIRASGITENHYRSSFEIAGIQHRLRASRCETTVSDFHNRMRTISGVRSSAHQLYQSIGSYLQMLVNIASMNYYPDALESLIGNKEVTVDVNAADANGVFPIFFAVDLGHVDVVDILIHSHVDLTKTTTVGNNVYTVAEYVRKRISEASGELKRRLQRIQAML